MVYAIILAAGSGERFNKSPIKPLFLIKHKPLFLHSLDTFLSSNKIDQILLVINKKHQSSFSKYLKALKYKKVLICYGDSSARYKSLINAMKYLKQVQPLSNRDIILTHDAARINVTTDIINMNISVAQKTGCASTVLPLHDSIGEIKNTMKYLDRTHKYLIQTPQTIQYKHWSEIKVINPQKITDLFTYLNIKIKQTNLVLGSLWNFKITTVEDLKLI